MGMAAWRRLLADGARQRVTVAAAAFLLAGASVGFLVWAVTTTSAGRLAWLTSMAAILAVVLSALGTSAAMLTWVLRSRRVATEAAGAAPPAAGRAAGADDGSRLPVAAPFGRLPAEIRGRDALLGELRTALTHRRGPGGPGSRGRRPGRAWVLAGMGGLGKSTVALAIARAAQGKGWRVWWVSAADTASLTGGMLEILRELRAPETVTGPVGDRAPTAADRAWEYLNGANPARGRWLLIFDNADDPAVLAGPGASPGDYIGWLRPGPRGAVIVTTRNRDARTWGRSVTLRELPPLDDAAAADVLADLAPGVADPGGQEARELGHRLGGLPLALHLAGAHLASPFARWPTFAAYHRALDSAELPAALADLGDAAYDARTDIQRTWRLSLDALADHGRPEAGPLLLLLSCYAPATPIPMRLVPPRLVASLLAQAGPPASGPAAADEAERGILKALAGLATAGLLDTAAGGGQPGTHTESLCTVSPYTVPSRTVPAQTLIVHPVVADANRAQLRTERSPARTVIGTAAVRLLHAACAPLDPASPADWPAYQVLAPHLLALLSWLTELLSEAARAELIEVTALTAEALVLGGLPGTAEELAHAGIGAGTGLRAGHPARLAIRRSLACAVAEQGRNQDAERLYRDVLPGQEESLGHEDRVTLATRFELVRVLGFLRDPQAERQHRELLADQERILRPDDPLTLTTRHWLGRLLMRLGRHEEAEKTYRQVLDGRCRILGERHPDTLVTRHTLAWAIAQQGRHAEAEQQFRAVMRDQREVETADHPHVLGSGRALGWCIAQQGRHAEAEQQFRQVLTAQQRVRGPDHPATLLTQHGLACALAAQGRYGQAKQLHRRTLDARLRIFGPGHPDTQLTREALDQVAAARGPVRGRP